MRPDDGVCVEKKHIGDLLVIVNEYAPFGGALMARTALACPQCGERNVIHAIGLNAQQAYACLSCHHCWKPELRG